MTDQDNAQSYLDMDLLRFTTAGSVDDGKSTLIGRLLYDSKAIFEDQLEAIEKTSEQRGDENVNLALLTDGLRAEREQGITIDVAYRYFATPRRKFIIADTPGHIQYTRNMVTGASTRSCDHQVGGRRHRLRRGQPVIEPRFLRQPIRLGVLITRHPGHRDLMPCQQPVQLLPQFAVRHRLLVGCQPAALHPAGHPLIDAACHVLRVGDQRDGLVRSLERVVKSVYALQPVHRRRQFHRVDGRLRRAAAEGLAMFAAGQHRCPAADARLCLARAVRVDRDFGHSTPPER